jgi:molybdenum cofactor synthesis domain-containing protein
MIFMKTTAVLTVSDSSSRGERADLSGPAVAELLRQHGFDITHQEIVPDEQEAIESALMRLSEETVLIVTTGGTGIAARDAGLQHTPYAVLSRGVCGVRDRTLILNLPGSPSGARQSLEAVIDILPHVIDLLAGKTGHGQ